MLRLKNPFRLFHPKPKIIINIPLLSGLEKWGWDTTGVRKQPLWNHVIQKSRNRIGTHSNKDAWPERDEIWGIEIGWERSIEEAIRPCRLGIIPQNLLDCDQALLGTLGVKLWHFGVLKESVETCKGHLIFVEDACYNQKLFIPADNLIYRYS